MKTAKREEIILLLKDIGYRPRTFDLEILPQELDYEGEYRPVGKLHLKITVVRTDVGFHMRIGGKGKVRFVCSRCLDEYVEDFSFSDENILRRGGHTGGVSLSDEDVDSVYIEKDEIDLLPLIREVFISNLPVKPVCDPSCKGLCPVCGVKLEDGHSHDPVQPLKLGAFLREAFKEGGKR